MKSHHVHLAAYRRRTNRVRARSWWMSVTSERTVRAQAPGWTSLEQMKSVMRLRLLNNLYFRFPRKCRWLCILYTCCMFMSVNEICPVGPDLISVCLFFSDLWLEGGCTAMWVSQDGTWCIRNNVSSNPWQTATRQTMTCFFLPLQKVNSSFTDGREWFAQ